MTIHKDVPRGPCRRSEGRPQCELAALNLSVLPPTRACLRAVARLSSERAADGVAGAAESPRDDDDCGIPDYLGRSADVDMRAKSAITMP